MLACAHVHDLATELQMLVSLVEACMHGLVLAQAHDWVTERQICAAAMPCVLVQAMVCVLVQVRIHDLLTGALPLASMEMLVLETTHDLERVSREIASWAMGCGVRRVGLAT
jgi:hypothetical protein